VAALTGASAVAITLGDQPLITSRVILGGLDRLPGYDAVRAVYDGAPGHPVVLGPRVLAAVGELEGDAGARELLARFRVRTWDAGHLASGTDIDTQEELSKL
jgi:CTP:molybdopterin cytidylyltransferase MocA